MNIVNTIEKTISLEEDGKVVLTPHNGQEASPEVLPINFSGLAKRTLSSLKLPRAVVANGLSSSVSVDECPSIDNSERTDGGAFDGSASHIQNNGRRRQKIFRESHSDSFGTNERRTHNLTPHDHPSNVASNDVEKVTEQIPVTKDPLETSILVKQKTLYWKKNDEAEAATNVGTFELINFKEVPYITITLMDVKLGTEGRKDLFDWLSRQLSGLSNFPDAVNLNYVLFQFVMLDGCDL
ncbi:Protein MOR1 [Camellia lanceoleosa]|uniref:Protein MOR1 n=1 Tax=Camellia lanceoleosa TaxID=1840588 RepID=A0ACC0HB86_9ERIC|nr:Protein MOR1 [Camellia lanceoleosa]